MPIEFAEATHICLLHLQRKKYGSNNEYTWQDFWLTGELI